MAEEPQAPEATPLVAVNVPAQVSPLFHIGQLAKGVWGWVENGHEKFVLYGVLAALLVIGWNEIKDLRGQLAQQKAETGTLATNFGKLGEAYTGQGALIQSQNAALAKAITDQGSQLTSAMTAQGQQIRATFEAQGKILASLTQAVTSKGVTPDANGGFTGAQLVQVRPSGPPVADVTLNFDPKNTDPMKRLTGQWSNYREDFLPSVIAWQKKTDQSYSGTFRLTRTVFKPDPSAPGGYRSLGTEDVPLTGANASFDIPNTVKGPEVSRWSIMGGPVYDSLKRTWNPGAGVAYKLSPNLGVATGFAGNNAFVWGSYTFSK